MSFFNPSALGDAFRDKRLKEDKSVPSAFGNLDDTQETLGSLEQEQKKFNSRIDEIRKNATQARNIEQQKLSLFLSGEGFTKWGRWARKMYGSPEAAKLKFAQKSAQEIANIDRQEALTIASLSNPMTRLIEAAQNVKDEAGRNNLMDFTENLLKENPGQGHVIPWRAEGFRRGAEGALFDETVEPPFVDAIYNNPDAIKKLGDGTNAMGIRSVSEDSTISVDMDAVMLEVFPNILSENAFKAASANYFAAQKNRLAVLKKEGIEDSEEEGIAGVDFAITDAKTKHTSTDAIDWRERFQDDFDKFRIFVLLQEVGVVERRTQFSDEWDPFQALQRLSETGSSLADIKKNRPLWRLGTARAFDFYSGQFHTPHAFGFVGAQDPDLLEELKQDPVLRKIIGLEHFPEGTFTGDTEAERIDLLKKREDTAAFLKELDERTKPIE